MAWGRGRKVFFVAKRTPRLATRSDLAVPQRGTPKQRRAPRAGRFAFMLGLILFSSGVLICLAVAPASWPRPTSGAAPNAVHRDRTSPPAPATPLVAQAQAAGPLDRRSDSIAADGNYAVEVFPDASKHAPAQSPAHVEEGVRQTLSQWASSAADNDVPGEMAFYSERLDRYFLRRNVSKAFVESDKRAYLNHGKRLQAYTLSNVRFEAISDRAVLVSFAKSWVVLDLVRNVTTSAETRSRLWLQRRGEGWKITGEQDLKAAKVS